MGHCWALSVIPCARVYSVVLACELGIFDSQVLNLVMVSSKMLSFEIYDFAVLFCM